MCICKIVIMYYYFYAVQCALMIFQRQNFLLQICVKKLNYKLDPRKIGNIGSIFVVLINIPFQNYDL